MQINLSPWLAIQALNHSQSQLKSIMVEKYWQPFIMAMLYTYSRIHTNRPSQIRVKWGEVLARPWGPAHSKSRMIRVGVSDWISPFLIMMFGSRRSPWTNFASFITATALFRQHKICFFEHLSVVENCTRLYLLCTQSWALSIHMQFLFCPVTVEPYVN